MPGRTDHAERHDVVARASNDNDNVNDNTAADDNEADQHGREHHNHCGANNDRRADDVTE